MFFSSTSCSLSCFSQNSLSLHRFTNKILKNIQGEVLLGDLSRAGFQLVQDPAEADAVVVNTCAFVEDAKAESLDAIMAAAALRDSARAEAEAAAAAAARGKKGKKKGGGGRGFGKSSSSAAAASASAAAATALAVASAETTAARGGV